MRSKKIFLLLGHPDKQGMCGRLAHAYEDGARAAGHEVRRMDLGDMKFDTILHRGYRERQELEPDLVEFQKNVGWADHFVIIYPVWWVGMPAPLKAIFDRAWLPGSAFRYIKMKSGKRTVFWHRMYRGKTARTILTSGTSPWLVRFLPGNVNAQLRWGILWFAGFSVRSMWFGPSENRPEAVCNKWCDVVYKLGREGR